MANVETASKRRTREEARLETRRKLLDAGAEVFAERGFHGASVEEIAERAGYTRGAFYSNFEGKDDLFLAVYDRRTRIQVEEISGLMKESSSPADLFTALRERRSEAPTDFEWMLLQHEFLLYALRNADVRPRFAERYRHLRRRYASAIQAVFDSIGLELPAPLEDMTLILNILDEGALPLRFLDPETVRNGFFFDALALLFESAVALAEKRAAQ